MDRKCILSPGGCLPLYLSCIQVHDNNIQTSSLKPLGQSKPNFMWNILRRGNESSRSHAHGKDGRYGYI